MAELVHLRLEHTLPELEEMERIGLFKRPEIRLIVKKRKAFEYKLRRKLKRKEDFLKYIEYEMNLLALIGKRRERLLCESKRTEIDGSIARRINRMFKGLISRYSEDEKLWLDQIQFCKKMKWYDSINALHTRMLQVHSKNPALWIMAAKWEMEEAKSPENARKLLQRGVVINPKSELLWREYFRMELMYTDLIRKRRAILEPKNLKDSESDESDAVLSGQVANVVYDMAVEAFNDVEYALSFIQICLDFDFGSRHTDYILNDVQHRFVAEEVLDAVAKKPLLHIEEQIKEGKENGIRTKTILENARQEIRTKYEEAVRQFPTEKMWSFYIDYVLSFANSVKETRKCKFQNQAIEVMERAAEENCLSQAYYSELVDLQFASDNENEALLTAIAAARKFNTADLWLKCLTYHIRCNKSHQNTYDLLIEAINSIIGKGSVKLWKLGVDWLSLTDGEKLLTFFEKGIQQCKEVSEPLKEMYLEACVLKKGIEGVRTLYKKYKKMGPLSPHIVKKMITIEKGQLNAPIELVRKYYEDGIQEFGSVNVDIWLEYMKLEVEHVGGNPTSYGDLYWRAKKVLKPDYLQEFQSCVTDLTTGCNVSSISCSLLDTSQSRI